MPGILSRQVIFRVIPALGIGAISLWYLSHRLAAFDLSAVRDSLSSLAPARIALALVAVALAFLAVAGQERAIAAHLALKVEPWRGARAAAASAALSQALGFGPVLGALVRRRLLPEVTLAQSFAISAGITLGFFGGLGLFLLALWTALPGEPHRGAAGLGLTLALGLLLAMALSRRTLILGLRKPNLFILARFLTWLALDLAALATAFWALLPPAQAPSLAEILPLFLFALGLGMASGSPGGLGAFEATLLALEPDLAAEGLLAGILVFRAIAFALPALCAALWILAARQKVDACAASAPEELQRLPPLVLAALPKAEAQLIRQGQLRLLAMPEGGLWLTGRLAHTRVLLGNPMNSGDRRGATVALARVKATARAEARLLCLYKIDARLAGLARSLGLCVMPVAREAVVDPGGFRLTGPDRARLRRKLAHARKAGIAVEDCPDPPLAEMEEVAAAWLSAHGRERGFSMGRWDRLYAAGQRVFLARATDGQLLGFVTFLVGRNNWVLDLVRFRPGTPDGTIYALIVAAIEAARWQEVAELSLAAVPVQGFGFGGWRGVVLRRLSVGGTGLEQFKQSFAPRWRKLYIAAPGRLSLVLGGLELARAILRPAPLPRGRRALVVFARHAGWARGAGLLNAARDRMAARSRAPDGVDGATAESQDAQDREGRAA